MSIGANGYFSMFSFLFLREVPRFFFIFLRLMGERELLVDDLSESLLFDLCF